MTNAELIERLNSFARQWKGSSRCGGDWHGAGIDHGKGECAEELLELIAEATGHASDCAAHDAPAYEAGACDCGATKA